MTSALAPTVGQTDLFEIVRRKTEAMQRSEAHASEEWKEAAMRHLRRLCETMPEFTVDDLIRSLGEAFARTHNLKGAGPMMTNGWKAGWMKKTDRVRTCSRPERNGGTVAVWQSLLFPR